MSYNLSAHTVWVDKGDHARYTSMTRVPSAYSEKPEYLYKVGDSLPRVVLAHAMAV